MTEYAQPPEGGSDDQRVWVAAARMTRECLIQKVASAGDINSAAWKELLVALHDGLTLNQQALLFDKHVEDELSRAWYESGKD